MFCTPVFSPLEQFEVVLYSLINNKIGFNFLLSNTTLFLILNVWASFFLLFFISYKFYVVPNSWQFFVEVLYKTIVSILFENVGYKGEKYFPLIFVLFIILLFSNLIGMIPYSFTVTSHIAFTFGLAFSIFIGITLIGIKTHGMNFLCIFLPKGVPLMIVPLLVAIEIISYIIKVFTLAIRLFANLTSGHTLLKIIASFGWKLASLGGLISFFQIIPLLVLFILTGLELGIAILQAYVFALLTCIYLNDVLEMH